MAMSLLTLPPEITTLILSLLVCHYLRQRSEPLLYCRLPLFSKKEATIDLLQQLVENPGIAAYVRHVICIGVFRDNQELLESAIRALSHLQDFVANTYRMYHLFDLAPARMLAKASLSVFTPLQAGGDRADQRDERTARNLKEPACFRNGFSHNFAFVDCRGSRLPPINPNARVAEIEDLRFWHTQFTLAQLSSRIDLSCIRRHLLSFSALITLGDNHEMVVMQLINLDPLVIRDIWERCEDGDEVVPKLQRFLELCKCSKSSIFNRFREIPLSTQSQHPTGHLWSHYGCIITKLAHCGNPISSVCRT
ncbi:hypothetical protein K440DRAFT_635947 [Wilcoxina mikolae CBS 423.85]|nr:hypothetical protein K440DRAFT_635947 [Wilcoxina mikolae CBS 423.85]